MSNNLLFQSFISKLDRTKDLLELRHNGFKVEKIYSYLKNLIKQALPEYKIRTLAVLLQHQYVEGFSIQELLLIGSLRIDLFSSNTNETIPPIISPNNYLYDTGSYKVYNDLYNRGLSTYQVNYLIASNKRSLIKFFIDCLYI